MTLKKGRLNIKVADLFPYAFSETKPQMVPMDMNIIRFQGLALIQGQIYNPEYQTCCVRHGEGYLCKISTVNVSMFVHFKR